MPPRRHHGGGRFRGRRGGSTIFVDEPVVYEEAVMLDTPDQIDAIFVPPTDDPESKVPGAGMTFFEYESDYPRFLRTHVHEASGPDENTTRAMQLDHAITALIQDMQQNMSANQDFLNLGRDVVALQAEWQAWRLDHSSYLQMTGTENDLDRFTTTYNSLRTRFAQVVGKAPSAPDIQNPPPSNPLGLPSMSDFSKAALTIGAVAALFIFGPSLARHL
jgi:hypothetical protein